LHSIQTNNCTHVLLVRGNSQKQLVGTIYCKRCKFADISQNASFHFVQVSYTPMAAETGDCQKPGTPKLQLPNSLKIPRNA